MPSYGVGVTLQYVAWNTSTNSYVTGDSANHTLRWVKDGTSAAPTNSPAEVDATNAPGVYKVVMTATETQCQVGTLAGKSSTANVVLIGITCTFENLPTASPAASGGLLTVGTGTGQIAATGGKAPALLTSTDVTGNLPADLQTIKTQAVSCSGGVTVPAATLASTTNITAGTITTVSGNVTGSVGSVTGAVGSVTGNVGGNVTGSVGSVATGGIASTSFAAGAITAAAIAADAIGASELAADAVSEIAGAVWDVALASHLTAGSTGNALNAAGSAGDPWSTSLPGAYGAGSAGYILGTNLDAAVTSRLAPTTAGRTLDVSATGEAGIDWGNVGAPTSTVDLSGTTISVSQAVASVSGSVGSVTGSVGSVGSGGITAASIATDAIDADALAADAVAEIADGLLGRNVAGGSSTGRLVKEALYFLRNKWTSSAGTLTVYGTDDTTVAWTSTVTTAAVDPVVSSDPS